MMISYVLLASGQVGAVGVQLTKALAPLDSLQSFVHVNLF